MTTASVLPLSFGLGTLAAWLRFSMHREAPIRRTWRLSMHTYRNAPRAQRLRQAIRWCAAAALHPLQARAWFRALDTPDRRRYLEAHPRVGLKLFRVYQSTRWTSRSRMKIILDTYGWLEEAGRALRPCLLERRPLVIAQLPLGDDRVAEIQAGWDDRFRKEGEVTFSLRLSPDIGELMTATISVEHLPGGGSAMRIGCLQGGGQADSADSIRDATKAMHGLRPRALLLLVLQEVARHTGITHLYGAGNAIQAHRRKRAVYLPRFHQLPFDYDAFWEECGGIQADEGWFTLPLETHRRTYEEIRPNKRGIYRKRYAMQDDLASQIDQALHLQG